MRLPIRVAALLLLTAAAAALSPPADQRRPASAAIWKENTDQDAADRSALNAILPEAGWFTILLHGRDASAAAWSIMQHQTNDPALMAAMLAWMENPARRQEVDPNNYALLLDRVAMLQHRKQTYRS